MDGYKEDIEHFISIFKENISAIQSVTFNVRDNLLKKILCVGIIDALSKVVYPEKGNHKRFTLFVKNFCDWKHSGKISLPHLIQLLKKCPGPEFSDLRKYSLSCIKNWSGGSVIKLDNDVEINEILKRWPKGYEKAIEKIKIESLAHYNLLYNYRNSIIHEMRRPPSGIEHQDDQEPYYLLVTSLDKNEEHWELVYPLRFFYKLCETGLTNLKEHLVDNQLNPYEYFVSGQYWIKELNK